MSSQPRARRPRSSGAILAVLIALFVVVLYFLNTGGLAYLLPGEYNVTLTPAPTVAPDAAAFAEGAPGGAQDAAGTPAQDPPAQAAAPTAAPTEAPTAAPTEAPTATPTATPTAMPTAMPAAINGLPTVAIADLPAEARQTIKLIDQGGPFPYDRDGITFQNRERLLPSASSGFYHEYTVPTPGESDRGARRIITGKDGVLYYTDDHYDSFRVVVR